MRWVPCNTLNPSITCIPETIIRDILFRFISEDEAFKVRGTCSLFSTAYFEQPHTDALNLRVIAMLLKGYKYSKLEKIALEHDS